MPGPYPLRRHGALAFLLLAACGDDPSQPPREEQADLVVTVTAPDSVPPGAVAEAVIRVRNLGPDAALDVVVSDTITGGTVETASAGGQVSGSVVSWPVISGMGPGAESVHTVTFRAPASGSARNAAAASSSTEDPDPSNNRGGAAASVVTEVELGWHLLTASPTSPHLHFQDASFISEDEGWVVGAFGLAYHTADGGATWERRYDVDQGVLFRSTVFVSPTLGWIGDLNAFSNPEPQRALWQTEDGGHTWINITDRVTGPVPVGVCGMRRIGEASIVGVGRWSGPAVFVRSDDRGATWRSVSLDPLLTGAVDVHFFDGQRGIVVGGRGVGNSIEEQESSRVVVLGTEDGGQTWEERFVGSAVGAWGWKISFPTPEVGYIATQGPTSGPVVLKTTDGGLTWSEIEIPGAPGDALWAAGFVTPLRGWVSSSPAGVMETSDGGQTWSLADWAREDNINRFIVLSDTVAYAIGGRVWRYYGEP